MAPKKSKGGGNAKKKATAPKGRRNGTKQPPQTDLDNKLVQQSQLNPQERVAFVRPLWENLSADDRVELLTVRVDDVVERLKHHQQTELAKQDGPELGDDLEKIYQSGLERLNAQETWKVWQWNADDPPYTCAETFKKEALEKKLPEELRKLLSREEGKPTEKPAEAALRERMTALINNIHSQLQSAQEAWRRGQRAVQEGGEQTRDANIDLVISILDALQHEHHCLYHTILTPVAEFICALVPAKNRKSTKTELFFEDFEKITPEDVAKLYEWLTEKVDALCSKLKPDPKDDEVDEDEEAVGDIDLFSLTEDKSAFMVNAKWLEHLQDRKLSEEGQPRKVKKGEDEHRVGLVLEWVYGSIVSTAEKARDGAKRSLGNWRPSVDQAYQNLLEMLKDQAEWSSRCKSAKGLLKDMLSSRKKIASLAKEHDVHIPGTAAAKEAAASCDALPDAVIEGVLVRESLLTQAKLHILKYERLVANNQLKTLRTELLQNEPEFERLKRELESAKNLARNSDKDRQRPSRANDAVLEDQLEMQSAFREQGARLQGMYDKRQRTELEVARREQEISQLQNWYKNVTQLLAKLRQCLHNASDSTAKSVEEATKALTKVRATFHKDFKKQLYSDSDDQTFFSRIKTELKTVDKRVEDGAVVLQHLEMFLINVACDDPGALIGTSVILPLLQERLDKKAMEFNTMKAFEAMDALLKMEEEKKESMKAKKARKSKSATQVEILNAMEDEPMQDDTADEGSRAEETAEEASKEVPSVETPTKKEPVSLGSHSMEDPALVEQSIKYEASLLAEAEAEEFQSVPSRRRGDKKKTQNAKRVSYRSPQRQRSGPVNRETEGASENDVRRVNSGPAHYPGQKTQSSGAKAFSNRSKSARFAPDSRSAKADKKPAANQIKPSKSAPAAVEAESGVEEQKSTGDAKPQKTGAAWVKGAIPASVTTKAATVLPLEVPQSLSSKKSSASETSVHVPSTPDASDVDHALTTVKSDPVPKETSTHIESALVIAAMETDEVQPYEHPELSHHERFDGDGDQFFSMVQAMNSRLDTSSNRDEWTDDDRSEIASARSSDAATPEPAHVMIGPPLMPPPMGMPPPIGHIPGFHPSYYGPPVRPMVDPSGVRYPPVPPFYHPAASAPATSTSPETSEAAAGSSSSSSPPPPAPAPFPFYGAPAMLPPGGPHLPPPFLPLMPYGQWFPPGMSPMAAGYESQVRKFPLRPTAEEFIPPSLRNDEAVSVINEEDDMMESPVEESSGTLEDSSNKTQHHQDYSTVDLPAPDVSDATTAVAISHTIEQTC